MEEVQLKFEELTEKSKELSEEMTQNLVQPVKTFYDYLGVYEAGRARVGWDAALGAGDDYELCFTVPPGRVPALAEMAVKPECALSYIGDIDAGAQLRMLGEADKPYRPGKAGYDHFR